MTNLDQADARLERHVDKGPAPDGNGRIVEVTPYVEPDPVKPGPHDHFDALAKRPEKVEAWSLRDPSVYTAPVQTYDADLDAMAVRMPDTGNSLSGPSQLWLKHAPLDAENCRSIVWQVDFRFSESIRRAGTVSGLRPDGKTEALSAWKLLRMDKPDGNAGFEFQTRFSATEQPHVALPSLRSYIGRGESRSADPLTGPVPGEPTNYDRHPGPDSDYRYRGGPQAHPERFALMPETWIRGTWEYTFDPDGTGRLRWWLADEDTEPRLILADPADPSKGFRFGSQGMRFGLWRCPEMNSSDNVLYDPPHEPWVVWLRNAVVLKDVAGTEVLGGKPIR